MKLTDIIKTQKEILCDDNYIENNIIKDAVINVIGHFGNCPTFEIRCSNVYAFSGYNNITNLGFLIHAFYDLFDICDEDGFCLNKIKKIPCRLIFDGDSWGDKCIGFGHFMEDKFVYSKDFAKIDEQ
jgi:hypothetical protein